jgi:hypothetical protein
MRTLVLLATLLFVSACLTQPQLVPRDAGRHDAAVTFTLEAFTIADANGHVWPASAAPRTPVITLTFSEPPADPGDVFLVLGAPDDTLHGELTGTRPRTSARANEIESTATSLGTTVVIRPSAPLAAGSTFTVAVPAWLSDADGNTIPAEQTIVIMVASGIAAGATATDAWPPDGATDVATHLDVAAIRFDGMLASPAQAITLQDATGNTIPGGPASIECRHIGWPSGSCVMIVPTVVLAPSTMHVLSVASGARDATGAVIPTFAAHFETGSGAPSPLALGPISCLVDETLTSGLCTHTDDESVALRGQLDAPARLEWRVGDRTGTLVAPRGDFAVRIDAIAPSTSVVVGLAWVDTAGHQTSTALTLTTTAPLPTISITEVRAYPAGSRPRQQYVELTNYGTTSVPLTGMTIAVDDSSHADPLGDVALAPDQRVLVVASTFDPSDTSSGDVAVPVATTLVRLAGSIGGRGLSIGGSTIYLRDADGVRISGAPPSPVPMSAVCNVRVSASYRSDVDGAFDYDPNQTCTPGR